MEVNVTMNDSKKPVTRSDAAKQRRQAKSVTVRVYKYGCLGPTEGHDLVIQQIRLGHDYYNNLIEIERWRREEWVKLYGDHDAKVADATARRDKANAEVEDLRSEIKRRPGTRLDRDIADIKPRLADARARAKQASADLKQARTDARLTDAMKEREQHLQEEAWRRQKTARHDFAARGLYWFNYELADDRAKRAAKKNGAPPRFRRWTGEGSIAVRLKGGGLTVQQLFDEDTKVRVDVLPDDAWETGASSRRAHTALRMRVGSDGKSPIWAVFPMLMHREIPPNAVVKMVKVRRERVATAWKWHASFVVEVPVAEQRQRLHPECADLRDRDRGRRSRRRELPGQPVDLRGDA
jgi:hypothetical protein